MRWADAYEATQTVRLRCAFGDLGEVHGLLGVRGAEKLSEDFDTEGVALRLRVRQSALSALTLALREASRGRILLQAED
ncbi:DUF1949 domain-containing protein [Aquimonas sp.]|uniref:DUF1949 domain-containing protein n=1 Tax=Aquimonas sp. TaxID=1872588 RepID=UPI0037BF428D